MSYARLGPDSDVYIVSTGDTVTCTWCKLHGDFEADRVAMLEHLKRHVEAGHKVPDYALDRLRTEVLEQVLATHSAFDCCWWLSFCDGSRPKGSQFLGVAIIPGVATDDPFGGIGAATATAHILGCNPGGEVSGYPHVPQRYWPAGTIGKLLTKEEALAADVAAGAKYESEQERRRS